MLITVNGISTDVPEEGRLIDLVPDCAGVAVARNGAVIPRGRLSDEALREGDVVEIVTAVQGG